MTLDKKVDKPDVIRSYLHAKQARERLLMVTIELLRELPFPKVTARAITKRADLALPTISRLFGSMSGLFNEVQKKLLNDTIQVDLTNGTKETLNQSLYSNPDLILRTRLVAWLALTTDQGHIYNTNLQRDLFLNFPKMGSSRRTKETYIKVVAHAIEGLLVFRDVNQRTQEELDDMTKMIYWLRAKLSDFDKDQGWAD